MDAAETGVLAHRTGLKVNSAHEERLVRLGVSAVKEGEEVRRRKQPKDDER